MNIELHTQGIAPTEQLKDHIERRLRFALTRFGRKLRRVHVTLSDQNGPKGGFDTQCKVRAELSDAGPIVIQQVHRDAFSAVARAADRISHAVGRQMERLNDRRRGRNPRANRLRGSVSPYLLKV